MLSTQTPSSVNVGAIAGGIVGGVVLLGAIFAFLWYKIRANRRSDSKHPTVEHFSDSPRLDRTEVTRVKDNS